MSAKWIFFIMTMNRLKKKPHMLTSGSSNERVFCDFKQINCQRISFDWRLIWDVQLHQTQIQQHGGAVLNCATKSSRYINSALFSHRHTINVSRAILRVQLVVITLCMLDATSAIWIKKRCVVFVKHVHVQAECGKCPLLCVFVCE